jgi:acyl dehydratase
MVTRDISSSALLKKVGQSLGVSSWIDLNQRQIDEFAKLTGDEQFIHVDPVAASSGPFGGTIAHGFLVLSLLSVMAFEALPDIEGSTAKINYGFDKVRFLSPVRFDASVRGQFTLKSLVERQPGQWLMTVDVVVEAKGEPKPALIAEWMTLTICSV